MCASGPSRRGAAAGLLVAVAALLALPLQAHAQTISIGAETDGTGDAEGVEGDTIELTVKLSAVSTGAVTAKWRYVEVRQRARRERSPPRPRPGRIPRSTWSVPPEPAADGRPGSRHQPAPGFAPSSGSTATFGA